MTKPLGSLQRVAKAADDLGLDIKIVEMDQSTRTAQEAAEAAGCDVAQIVKSLIFERADDATLVLVLVSGAHNADMDVLKTHVGTKLIRADPRKIRDQTGFAIGGVAPIGHLIDLPVLMDKTLLSHETVWAAAGKPNAVFEVKSDKLADAVGARIVGVR